MSVVRKESGNDGGIKTWEDVKLSDVSSFITKGSTPTTYGFRWEKSGVLFLRSECVSAEGLNLEQSMFISEAAHRALSRSEIKKRDILITITGNVGRVVMTPNDLETANINQHIARIRVVDVLMHPDWVYHFLSQPSVRKYFEKNTTGQAYPQISLVQVREIRIPQPSLPEQQAIAQALSDVDALIAALDRLIDKKRDIKQATMQQLLTGKTRLPEFSGKWETKPLGLLFNFGGGYSASRDQLSTEGYCYLHYGDIHGSKGTCIDTDADFQNIPKLDIPLKRVSSASLLDDGDVVFVDASEDDEGTSKHIVVVNKSRKPFISGLHTIVAKSKTDELSHAYRRYCFQTTAIRRQFLFYSVGTKVSGISKSNIPKLVLSFPSVPEQTAIATVLSDIDAELSALEARRDKTRNLKQGMMQELLTGKTRLI